jgi:hypothetical protein
MPSIPCASKATGEQGGGGQRVEVELTRQPRVQRLQSPGRREQQARCLAATICGEGDAGAEDVDLGLLEFVQRARVRAGSKGERLIEGTRLLGCLGRGQGPPGATRGVERQHRGALEEGRGGGEPARAALALPTVRGARDLSSGMAVACARCQASDQVDGWIGRFREGAVDSSPLIRPNCPVHRRRTNG